MNVIKDPDAVLDYGLNWAGDPVKGIPSWLAEDEAITTSTWIVPNGITKNSESHSSTSATVWLSGGTAGETYEVTNRITTNQGRTDDRTIYFWIAQR